MHCLKPLPTPAHLKGLRMESRGTMRANNKLGGPLGRLSTHYVHVSMHPVGLSCGCWMQRSSGTFPFSSHVQKLNVNYLAGLELHT